MEKEIKNVKYGLMVLDPRQKNDEYLDVLHFCGYLDEPTAEEVNHLRIELKDDPEFGLQDIWDIVDILPAPDYILKEILDKLEN